MYDAFVIGAICDGSPPARGAWIEMHLPLRVERQAVSRPPHGGRGLKCCKCASIIFCCAGRPPHGGRGLKYRVHGGIRLCTPQVAPRTGGVD